MTQLDVDSFASAVDPAREQRVLLRAPTRKDAEITCSLLKKAGMACVVCESLDELNEELGTGTAALLLTEDVFTDPAIENLLLALEGQPSWSDLPVVILMQGGVHSLGTNRVLQSLRNVTLLERPAPTRSVVSAPGRRRAREQQYETRAKLRLSPRSVVA